MKCRARTALGLLAIVLGAMPQVRASDMPFLKVGAWLNPEPWHDWIGPGITQVQLLWEPPAGDPIVPPVAFFYSLDGGSNYTKFGTDMDGTEPTLATYGPCPRGDGWSGYFSSELIHPPPPEPVPVLFMAEIRTRMGIVHKATAVRIYDPKPPSAFALNVRDWDTVHTTPFALAVTPEYPENFFDVYLDIKEWRDVLMKGIPTLCQNDLPNGDKKCAPTAAAACLSFFGGEVTGGLEPLDLAEALCGPCKTDPATGTKPSNWARGILEWIANHGGGYTVRGWLGFDWPTMRNELAAGQNVLVGIFWPEPPGGGHAMTMNSMNHPPLPNGRIEVDFMDPWCGKIGDGELDPATGELTNFTGPSGDRGELGVTIIVCPEEPGPGGRLPGDAEVPIQFPHPGNWFVRVTVVDLDNHAHTVYRIIGFTPGWRGGWQEVESVPAGRSGRPLKHGACLTLNPGDASIYAAKGTKTTEFYRYRPLSDQWQARESVPSDEAGRVKPSYKGCRVASDRGDNVYLVKGNNTLAFLRYDVAGDSWQRLTDVPAGEKRKKVKGGGDLVYAERNDSGHVYLLKGYKTEFYRYNIGKTKWDTLPLAPWRVKEKYAEGSFLVYDGAHTIYCHQASYYDKATLPYRHAMFRYDIRGDTWYTGPLRGMPLLGQHKGASRNRKSKDGGAGAWYSGNIYALKGGNSQQFFSYFPVGDSWRELDTIPSIGSSPRPRMVKAGGDICHYYGGTIYALKGNRCLEFWRYVPAAGLDLGSQTAGSPGRPAATAISVRPSPLGPGSATISYALPAAVPSVLTVVDVVGRVVHRQRLPAAATGTVTADLRRLAAGVYLVRLESGRSSAAAKLVIER